METQGPTVGDATIRHLEGELRLVREAILMVASGGSRSVMVAGLRLGEELLEAARREAAAAGVVLVPLWSTDESGLDIRIEAAR